MRDRILERLYKKKKKLNKGGTAAYQYNMGGMQQLPGGIAQQIPNSDAVEFIGQSHDDGGIMVDPQTEVEGGETMDKVTMNEGGLRDYFFSDHLKHGGIPFAQHHKNILAMGGTQEDIDYLAKMQEKKANRDPNKVYAKTGGVMQYSNGGTFKARNEKSLEMIQIMKDLGYDVPDYLDLGNPDISNAQGHQGAGYYGDSGVDLSTDENRKDFYERNKDILNKIDSDNDGQPDIDSWDDFDPKVHTGHFQKQFNQDLQSFYDSDPKLQEALTDKGYTFDDLQQFGFFDSPGGADTGIDEQFGQYTWSRSFPFGKKTPTEEPCPPPEGGCPEGQNWNQETCACEGGYEITTTEITEQKNKKDWSGALLGLGSMIPAVMAFTEKPDYMENPDLMTPGIVKPERIAKTNLDRVDFNDQIARNANDATAMNKFIETSGGGPANMANKMAAYAQKQQGDREIKAQEAKANVAIANQEASMDQQRKAMNAEAALNASKFNVSSQEKAEMQNIRNNMYVDEFNAAADAATKDRRLNAVQYGIDALASLHRDKLTKQASDNLAAAVDGQRGALDRFFKSQNLKNNTTSNTTTNTITYGPDGRPITSSTSTEPTEVKNGGYRKLKFMRRYGK